jgi:probable phosphoglycerate mutase
MLPAKSFYLIRHGESQANRDQLTAGGGTDSPLTDKGRQQAKSLAPYLKQLELKPGAVYHSTMMRARDTAMILNEGLKLPATAHHDLREHEMGLWEGQPWATVQPLLDGGENPPSGETDAVFSQRIQSILTDIMGKHNGADPPMVVAHGGLFHAIGLLYEYGMTHVSNCHLHLFEPYPAFDNFPWRVWQFDIDGDKLVKNPAPFCLSQAMAHIVV